MSAQEVGMITKNTISPAKDKQLEDFSERRQWYRVLRYCKGFGVFDSVRRGPLAAPGPKRRLVMAPMEIPNAHSDCRAHLSRTRNGGSLLEVDVWTPSEINAISPLVRRLMRLIEESHCITDKEHATQIALREAANNAVVHGGNRLNARKLVHVRCRCKVRKEISLAVSDEGQAFDASTVRDPTGVKNLEGRHGRGIHLVKSVMNQVSFKRRGTEVHMCKTLGHVPQTDLRRNAASS